MADDTQNLDGLLGGPKFSLADPAQIAQAHELCNTIWSAGGDAFGVMLGHGVLFTEGEADFNDPRMLLPDGLGECLVCEVEWVGDRSGTFRIILPALCAKTIIAFMLAAMAGATATPEETALDADGLDAFKEAISQFLGASAQSLRQKPGGKVNLNLKNTEVVALDGDAVTSALGSDFSLVSRGTITIEGAVPFEVYTVMEQALAGINTVDRPTAGDSGVHQALAEKKQTDRGARYHAIKKLRLPVYVTLADRLMRMSDIMTLVPGSIIEFRKSSETFLDLCVGHTCIARGEAVIVNEHFGLQVRETVNLKEYIATRNRVV